MRAYDVDEAVAVLSRTPVVLRAMLAGLPEAWLVANEGEGTWSPFDVVGHLNDGEETDWIPRARIILEHGAARPFQPFDRLRHRTLGRDATIAERLARFERLRADNLDALRALRLQPADLEKRGMHPELGEVTLSQLLATWVAHDLDHIVQIARAMARRYRDDAGPWTAYVRVLRDA